MLNKLFKAAAWAKAPKAMFAVTNPRKAAVLKAADWVTDRLGLPRRRTSPARTAIKGVAAAAVALPIGLWLGKRGRGSDAGEI